MFRLGLNTIYNNKILDYNGIIMKKKKNVLVGVCGGIASYKTCELVRLLIKGGFSVKVMMTEAATKFVSGLVFQELSGNPVYLDMFTPLKVSSFKDKRTKLLTGLNLAKGDNVKHISLAQWADICVVAPASANTISKVASGLCDNLLTTVICALPAKTKVLFAPAMNECMWKNSIISENVKKLEKIKKYLIMSPGKGELACGIYGEGKMPQAADIYRKIKSLLS